MSLCGEKGYYLCKHVIIIIIIIIITTYKILRRTFLGPNTSTALQTLTADAHLAVG
jgi:hypothetical protein